MNIALWSSTWDMQAAWPHFCWGPSSRCGWAAPMQLHAVVGAWVSVEVEGQCFVDFQLPDPLSMEIPLSHNILLETEFITQGSCDLLTKSQAPLILLWESLTFIEAEFPEHHCVSQVKNVGTQDSLCAEEGRLSYESKEEQTAFWSRAQLHWEKLITLSRLALCARRHVVYWTMQNKGLETQGGEIMKVMLISNTSKQRRGVIQYSEKSVFTWQVIKMLIGF